MDVERCPPRVAPRRSGAAGRHHLGGPAIGRRAAGAGYRPEDFPDLPELVTRTRKCGFEPGYGHVSTLAEWDDYEWSWTGSLVTWALQQARDPAAREQALSAAREHREAWLGGYRQQLGFVTLVLHDIRQPPETLGQEPSDT